MDPGTIATPGLSLATRTIGGITVAELSGDLDLASAPALRDQLLGLLRPGASRLVIGLSQVSYCDASGLAVLVGTARRARLLGGFFHLAEVSPSVDRVLRLTGLQWHFGVFPSIQAATTSLQHAQQSQHGHAGAAGRPPASVYTGPVSVHTGAASMYTGTASAHTRPASMYTGPASRLPGPASSPTGLPRATADFGELRKSVAALLTHADAWRDADPGRRFTPALQAMDRASHGADDVALATAARSLLSALARHPLTHSPAVARTATRLRRVFDPEFRPAPA
jgi:anti-sigma B factor antagonist